MKHFEISGHAPLVYIIAVDVRGNREYIKRCSVVHKNRKRRNTFL